MLPTMIAMIGLGRMGANMALRLQRGGHRVVGYAPSGASRAHAQALGLTCVDSLTAAIERLEPPRVVWLMVPSGEITTATLAALQPLLQPGDIVIDGGNTNYRETQAHAAMLAQAQITLIDCGTSGGVWGLEGGYSLMIGGDAAVISTVSSLFKTLAPSADSGWGRVGASGAGHFVKMIHNGIEYGLMQAYAEGFAILERKQEFALDTRQIAEIWREGSVVRSWLLDLTAAALAENPALAGIAPYVADSGEGRWTVAEAIALDVAAPVITLALLERLRSREPNSYADRLLAALRQQFGGHSIQQQA